QRIAAADGQRHAVHDHGVIGADAIEHMQRLAAVHHVVLGNDLEPVHGRAFVQNGFVVIGTQSQSETEVRPLGGCSGFGHGWIGHDLPVNVAASLKSKMTNPRRSLHGASRQRRPRTSCMSYSPAGFCISQRAARSAPAAKVRRLVALWLISTRSPSPANNTV